MAPIGILCKAPVRLAGAGTKVLQEWLAVLSLASWWATGFGAELKRGVEWNGADKKYGEWDGRNTVRICN